MPSLSGTKFEPPPPPAQGGGEFFSRPETWHVYRNDVRSIIPIA